MKIAAACLLVGATALMLATGSSAEEGPYVHRDHAHGADEPVKY